jgi:hypothetical protein
MPHELIGRIYRVSKRAEVLVRFGLAQFGRVSGMCLRSTPWSSTARAMYSPSHPCGLLDAFSYPRFL